MSNQFTSGLRALQSGSFDDASRAADAILKESLESGTAPVAPVYDAVATCVERGFRSASLVLLLGYFDQGKRLLQQLSNDFGNETVKIESSSRPVELRLAATLALARIGDPGAEKTITDGLTKMDSAHRVFMLDVLPYVQSPQLLSALAALLADVSEIPEGVPSGAQQRRVCDHALEAFVHRNRLAPSFVLEPGGQYSVAQLAEVRELLAPGKGR
ncbi:MAG: hypothetical protein ABIZ64_03250 [Casimicrobium sp.]|jgi:hypothetical protein